MTQSKDIAGTETPIIDQVSSSVPGSIFLSHSHVDKPIARQIYHGLRDDGIRCWIDEAEIKPGMSIIAALEGAIDDADYLGVVLTPTSVTSTTMRR